MDAVATIPKRFKSSAEQQSVVALFPTFDEIRGSLYKHRSAEHTPIPDPLNLPDELRTTVRGKSVGPDDVNYQERFLLYSGQEGKLLVFSADTELRTLFDSDYVVCDGTFEMAPDCCYQLYTLHGYNRGEGMPLVWALLPNKSKRTYVELFTCIRNAFAEKFNDSARRRLFLTDFEIAAIDAVKEVFPESSIKGCTFHFRQALMRRVADLGLRPEYSSENTVVKDWIRQIMGLTLLPTVFLPAAWSMLKQPPTFADSDLMSKLVAFSNYFEKTWMTGSFQSSLWNHFDNTGPRTTNLAEGWHNSMNHSFGMPHPSARNFMHWLQKVQFEVQCRQIQLEAGRPPKNQSATYRELDERIATAKLQFGLRSGNLFVTMFPYPEMWPALHAEIVTYLKHVSYLIAGKALNL